jgi:hypothetical protein
MPGDGPQTETMAITQGHLRPNAESPLQRRAPTLRSLAVQRMTAGTRSDRPFMRGLPVGPVWLCRPVGIGGGEAAAGQPAPDGSISAAGAGWPVMQAKVSFSNSARQPATLGCIAGRELSSGLRRSLPRTRLVPSSMRP